MLDIETLGKKPGCIVLSIGAVFFDPHQAGEQKGHTFYRNITQHSCKLIGLVEDPDTVKWWSEQKPEAWARLADNQQDVWQVAADFIAWFISNGGEKIWCQGATFDAPIMEEVFNRLGLTPPWKFFNIRDTRTVYDICGFNSYSVKREGTYHNALDDSLHQVKCVTQAIRWRG